MFQNICTRIIFSCRLLFTQSRNVMVHINDFGIKPCSSMITDDVEINEKIDILLHYHIDIQKHFEDYGEEEK